MTRRDAVLAPDQQELKAATRALIRAAGGTDASGAVCGVAQQTASDWQARNLDKFVPVNAVAALEDITSDLPGWPHVTRVLARRQGFALVKLPDAVPQGADLLLLLSGLSEQAGGITQGLCAALADARVTAGEAAELRARFFPALIDVAVALDATLAAIEGGAA